MIVILESKNGVEAHMMLHLLQQSGIEGQINGKDIQGAPGVLPLSGDYRVSVRPPDADAAKKLAAGWTSVRPTEAKEEEPETTAQKGTYFVAGAAAAAVALFLLFRFPGTGEGFDYDGDGKLDTVTYLQGGLISKIEHDRNRDGKVDLRWIYGLDGSVETMKADNDFNGTFEKTTSYIDGNPVVERIDSSGDGSRDIHSNYADGVLTNTELYDPFTNIRIKISRYDAFGRLVESEFDSDGNGSLDQKVTYDAFAEPIPN